MEDTRYTTKSMIMHPGDTLLVYTDGVTEAMDNEQNLYSEKRLVEVINQCNALCAESFISTIDASLKAFTGGAEQSDDITMLVMQFLGKENEQ